MTPDFIPFEAMTMREKREHLWRLHGVTIPLEPIGAAWHRADHRHGFAVPQLSSPHTHDKPTRRTR